MLQLNKWSVPAYGSQWIEEIKSINFGQRPWKYTPKSNHCASLRRTFLILLDTKIL